MSRGNRTYNRGVDREIQEHILAQLARANSGTAVDYTPILTRIETELKKDKDYEFNIKRDSVTGDIYLEERQWTEEAVPNPDYVDVATTPLISPTTNWVVTYLDADNNPVTPANPLEFVSDTQLLNDIKDLLQQQLDEQKKVIDVEYTYGYDDANDTLIRQVNTVSQTDGTTATTYTTPDGTTPYTIVGNFVPASAQLNTALETANNLLTQLEGDTSAIQTAVEDGFAQNNTDNTAIISELQDLNTEADTQTTALNTINSSIQAFQLQANTDATNILTQLQTTDAVIDNLLVQATAINANTDTLEALQTANTTAIDELNTDVNNFADQNTLDLQAINTSVQASNGVLNDILVEAEAINLNTDTLEALQTATNTAIATFNTNTQANLATIITNTGNAVTELQTANTTLTGIATSVDGLEQGQTDLQTAINNFATANDGNFTEVDTALATLNTTQTAALADLNTLVTQTAQLQPLLEDIKAFYEGNFTITGQTNTTFPFAILGGIYNSVVFKVNSGRIAFQGAQYRRGDVISVGGFGEKTMAAASITSVAGTPSISINFNAY